MNFQIILVFALCLTFFCLIDEAPAGGNETGEPSKSRRGNYVNYSPQEDQFILQEAQAQTQLNRRISWKLMAEKHARKVSSEASGFEKKRSSDNLRQHFAHLKHDLLELKATKTSNKHTYSKEEEEFINKELMNDSFQRCSLYGDEVWDAILEKHNLKRQRNCEGFTHERTASGLRFHVMRGMRPGKRISKDVEDRFPWYFKPSQEDARAGNLNLDKAINSDHDREAMLGDIAGSSRGKQKTFYSKQENEFIIRAAIAEAEANGEISWSRMARQHELNVKAKASGFGQKRSANQLRQHFKRLRHRIPPLKTKGNGRNHKYTKQEEEFINKELLNDSFRMRDLLSDEIWQAVLEKHNLKRKQKCEGFSRERTLIGLRYHFLHSMRPGKRVLEEVKARFPSNFKNLRGTRPSAQNFDQASHPDHYTDPAEDEVPVQEDIGEGYDIYDIIMRDLDSMPNHEDIDQEYDIYEDIDEEYDIYDTIMKDLDNNLNDVDDKGIDLDLFVDKGFPSHNATDWFNADI